MIAVLSDTVPATLHNALAGEQNVGGQTRGETLEPEE